MYTYGIPAIAIVGAGATIYSQFLMEKAPELSIDAVVLGTSGDDLALTRSLLPIGDDIFESTDNLLVISVERVEDLEIRAAPIAAFVRLAMESPALRQVGVTVFYNVAPNLSERSSNDEVYVMAYKGMRKQALRVPVEELEIGSAEAFFKPVSEKITPTDPEGVPYVTYDTFKSEVIDAATPSRPILLQMYEDSCFMCFLMRPFVNAIFPLLQQAGIPLEIRRLNIEKNDFPEGCPISRATPTFCLFSGEGAPAMKWEEFKPSDLVQKIEKIYMADEPEKYDSLRLKLTQLIQGVGLRLQMFTQLVMWQMEVSRIQEALAGAVTVPNEEEEKAEFNATIMALMAEDMVRTDTLPQNLRYLQEEIDSTEKDAVFFSMLIGERVLESEAL